MQDPNELGTMDLIIMLYGLIFLTGLLGNGVFGLTLCCGPGAKTRNPLLFGLILGDLMVCCLSGPATAATYMSAQWTQSWVKLVLFVQTWPVSISTLSMMALSVDRYLTVKNYRAVGQVVQRRYLLVTAVLMTWALAALLSASQFVAAPTWRRGLLATRVLLVHVVPPCAVLACHLGVHAKLTALSLTARAQHGELPLPMPLLRRPTHVIIVAGISKQDRGRLQAGRSDGSREDEDEDEAAQPPTSTLRSRRRLANSLLWIAALFAVCWLPSVVCQVCGELGTVPPRDVRRYALLVGHLHSIMGPLLYWSVNHRAPQKLCTLRLVSFYRSASSTNEAALGPFHPRFVRPPPMRRRSSHYLY